MNTKKALFVVLISVLGFSSCTDNDANALVDVALEGEWVLENVTCFCGFSEDFDFSQHRIIFDVSASTADVFNTDEVFFITDTGKYDVQVRNPNRITISRRQYTYEVNGTNLVLNFIDNPDLSDDEILLSYQRAE